tara:strand:+ start:168 stop:425 length:258 start_codon:yes stop_codon:yes gene_type:complete
MPVKKKIARSSYTLDWYLKWVASTFVLLAMSMRGVEGMETYDLLLSTVGICLWLCVSIIWQDRALILLNGVGLMFLLNNLFKLIA